MTLKPISREDLSPAALRDAFLRQEPPVVFSVFGSDAHAEARLPGAQNFCVYETAFLDKIRAAFPDPETALLVYGWSDATHEAEEAVRRLQTAGYRRVAKLAGGLEGWRAFGGEVEGTGSKAVETPSGIYKIDTALSTVLWTGQNVLNFHHGKLNVGGGELEIQDGTLLTGKITLDMRSIYCIDLADRSMAAMLEAHLRSEDFFDADRFPTAEFCIQEMAALSPQFQGVPNHRVTGSLTLRGVTQPLSFDAVVGPRPGGGFAAQAQLDIDRTRWGVLYGSSRFFARLGQHLVNDLIHLHLKIVTEPTAEV